MKKLVWIVCRNRRTDDLCYIFKVAYSTTELKRLLEFDYKPLYIINEYPRFE